MSSATESLVVRRTIDALTVGNQCQSVEEGGSEKEGRGGKEAQSHLLEEVIESRQWASVASTAKVKGIGQALCGLARKPCPQLHGIRCRWWQLVSRYIQ